MELIEVSEDDNATIQKLEDVAKKLEAVARQALKIETTAEVEMDGGKRITISIEQSNCIWTYKAVGVAKRESQGGVILTIREPRQSERPDGLIEETSWSGSLYTVLGRIRTICHGGILLTGTISASSSKSLVKGKELKQIVMETWCEVFETAVPVEEEMKKQQTGVKKEKAQRLQTALQELRSGPEGVAKWNLRPLEERLKNLISADFSDLDLSEVKFYEADLSEAVFAGTTLKNALLSQCKLKATSFARANIEGTRFAMCKAEAANFSGAHLVKATFSSTILSATNFQNADLRESEFTNAYADESGKRMLNVDFQNADLRGARFIAVKLLGANFLGAKLEHTKFINSTYDHETRFPADFELANSGLIWLGVGPDPVKVKDLQKASPTIPPDFQAFLKLLEKSIDSERLKKTLQMLKEESFQLFSEVDAESMLGVVKSQTNPDLLYACTLSANGQFTCCTQNLNLCGGLKDSLCKHLLVLIIGLVRSNKLNAMQAEEWARMSRACRPELDKEGMIDVFFRYKCAEAGENDWRPTETIPEDYYAY